MFKKSDENDISGWLLLKLSTSCESSLACFSALSKRSVLFLQGLRVHHSFSCAQSYVTLNFRCTRSCQCRLAVSYSAARIFRSPSLERGTCTADPNLSGGARNCCTADPGICELAAGPFHPPFWTRIDRRIFFERTDFFSLFCCYCFINWDFGTK